MSETTSPKPSYLARKQAREEKTPNEAPVIRPVRSPEELAAIQRFYETGIGAKDISRPCHLI